VKISPLPVFRKKKCHYQESRAQPVSEKITDLTETIVDSPKDLTESNQSTVTHFDPSTLINLNHGLNITEFDPNNHFASNLFADSSTLERTKKKDADSLVDSIEEKRQTLRIAKANIALNSDVVTIGKDYQKLVGNIIDFSTTRINNQTKFVGYQSASVNQEVAYVKLSQVQEKLTQEGVVLNGMKELTPLIVEEWVQRKALKVSKIADLKGAVHLANSKLDAQLQNVTDSILATISEG
jgi:hypothetical protein